MKSRAALSIALSLAVLVGVAPARASITVPYSPDGTMNLAPGVRHEWGTLVTGSSRQQYVNVTEVDPSDPSTEIRLSQADGVGTSRKSVIEQAEAYGDDARQVVATVNGSTFFYLVHPDGIQGGAAGQGLNVSDGELINAGAPVSNAQIMAFGVDDSGNSMIGYPQLDMQLTLPGNSEVRLTRINQKRLDTDVVLFTPRFDTHTWTTDLGDEYVVEGFDLPLQTTGSYSGTVVAAYDGSGDNTIGPGQVVISVADGWAGTLGSLSVGDTVSLSMSIDEPWREMANSVGGRNMLVVGGASVVTSTAGVHPRTAVGVKADGQVILVTADSGTVGSGGMNLFDLADLMLSLGAVDAVNLDGGGSVQMAVREPGAEALEMVSTMQSLPEDLRPVSNALQVVSDASFEAEAPVVDAPRISLSPVAKVATRGASLEASWTAIDESSIDSVDAQAQVGDSAWQQLTPASAAATGAPFQVPYGRPFRVRVRATDRWGNTSAWVVSKRLRVTLINESDAALIRSGGWRLRSDSHSFGGAYRRSRTTAARAELAFDGYQVGLVGLVGTRGGSAQIRMDGDAVASVDTYAATVDQRRLLFLGPAAENAAPHLIEVRNAGTDAKPLVEIDAFLVLEDAY